MIPEPTLRIGHVVLPGTTFRITPGYGGGYVSSGPARRTVTLNGVIQTGESFEVAGKQIRAWKDDLDGHKVQEDVVPVIWSKDPLINGFYVVREVQLQTWAAKGNYPFTIALECRDRRFESALTANVLTNSFDIDDADAEPTLTPPAHYGFDPGASIPAQMVRTLASGTDLIVYREIDTDTPPSWSSRPEDWPVGACVAQRSPALLPVRGPIVGLWWTGKPNQVELQNGLVRVMAGATSTLELQFFDGELWRARKVNLYDGADLILFDDVSPEDCRPETTTYRYEYSTTSGGRIVVDVTIRRGVRGVGLFVQSNDSSTLGIRPDPAEATTAAAERTLTAAGADGHKLLIVSPLIYDHDSATGMISRAAAVELDAFVTLELQDAVAGDTAAAQSLQYLAMVNDETVAIDR